MLVCLSLCLIGCLAAGCQKTLQKYTQEVYGAFDTVIQITAYAENQAQFDELAQLAEDELLRLSQLYDIYTPYQGVQGLYQLNQQAGQGPVKLEPEALDLLEFGQDCFRLTEGRVNVAMGAVLSIWHDLRLEAGHNPDQARLPRQEELEAAAGVIEDARRVVFVGCGGSGAVAYDAMHKFLKIGIHSFIHTDVDIQSMQSALLGPGDVAFGISHSGGNQNVLECLKNARDCGATLVGLTTYGKSPMQRLCDYLLMTSTKESIFRSESVTARVAQLSVIDSLVAVMSYMDYDSAFDAIQRTRKATSGRKY